jgi:hypothetical protein
LQTNLNLNSPKESQLPLTASLEVYSFRVIQSWSIYPQVSIYHQTPPASWHQSTEATIVEELFTSSSLIAMSNEQLGNPQSTDFTMLSSAFLLPLTLCTLLVIHPALAIWPKRGLTFNSPPTWIHNLTAAAR